MIPESLDRALQRLTSAIDQLEAAVDRRLRADDARRNGDDEWALMQDDRARLATELDGALARGRALEEANDAVGLRLERAGATVRAILAEIAPGEAR